MMLAPDRFFDPDPSHKTAAMDQYALVQNLPIVSPHEHVDPFLLTNPNRNFGNPVELLIQPDHYVLRMFYSQHISYEQLLSKGGPRPIWQLFAENFYLFRSTPSGIWLTHALETVFGITEKLDGKSAARIYDQLEAALCSPAYSPRILFEKLKIEVLATTDAATDTLQHHQAMRAAGWRERIVPTLRQDGVVSLDACPFFYHRSRR